MNIEGTQASAEGGPGLVLGAQLRKARMTLELPVEEVAKGIGVTARDVLSWETERFKPTLSQLENLAELYGRNIDYFLKITPPAPTQIQFRSSTRQSFQQLSAEARRVIARFDELCRAAVELEESLGRSQQARIGRVPPGSPPKKIAAYERDRLGLNDKPISNLRGSLEEIGVRIFEIPVPNGEFSGFSCNHPRYGPCILVNAADNPGRRNFTLAHEYGHLLYAHGAWACDIGPEGKPATRSDERAADIFAIEFLMPGEALRTDFVHRGLTERASVSEFAKLAEKWKVSIQAFLYRLEDLGLIKPGSADRILSSYQPAARRFGRPRRPIWKRRLGERFVANAIDAYAEGHISLGKLTLYLGVPIRKALEVAEAHRASRRT